MLFNISAVNAQLKTQGVREYKLIVHLLKAGVTGVSFFLSNKALIILSVSNRWSTTVQHNIKMTMNANT